MQLVAFSKSLVKPNKRMLSDLWFPLRFYPAANAGVIKRLL
jgi:hypothetical protein